MTEIKYLILYIFLLFNVVKVYAQEDKYIDSIINVIDRMTTNKLNKSDTIYIDD
ncbi:MAG: hypothetical protein R2771_09860 [Saprospiraceae bacterium]